MTSVPCRFFVQQEDMEVEMALAEVPAVRQVLPMVLHAHDSSKMTVSDSAGYRYSPCFIVRERGATLRRWRARPRTYTDVLALVDSLAQLLRTLHGSGRVHCNLTPDGVVLLQHSNKWRLLDLELVANAGAARASAVPSA
jgi:hypothetical protein